MASLLQAALCPSDMLTVYVCWHMYWQELDMAKLFGSIQHRETPDLCLYNLFGWSEDINPPLPPRSKAKSCTGFVIRDWFRRCSQSNMTVKHCALLSAITTRFTHLLALFAKTLILCFTSVTA